MHTWRDTAAGSVHQSQPPQLPPGSASPKWPSSCARRQRSATQYCTTFARSHTTFAHPSPGRLQSVQAEHASDLFDTLANAATSLWLAVPDSSLPPLRLRLRPLPVYRGVLSAHLLTVGRFVPSGILHGWPGFQGMLEQMSGLEQMSKRRPQHYYIRMFCGNNAAVCSVKGHGSTRLS